MATQTTFSSYTQSLTNAMTTELNSLGNGSAAVATSGIDNTANLDLWADFQLNVTFGSAPTAGTTVDLYLIPSLDGTNYADSGVTLGPYYVGAFPLRATTSAQIQVVTRVPLIPGKFKPYVVNNAGQAFPASGSTVQYRSYHITNT